MGRVLIAAQLKFTIGLEIYDGPAIEVGARAPEREIGDPLGKRPVWQSHHHRRFAPKVSQIADAGGFTQQRMAKGCCHHR